MRRFPITSLGELTYVDGAGGLAEIVVVVTLYNYADTVVEAIESIVNQNIDPLAIIVVDDCSTDNGGNIAAAFLRRYASRFTTARVVRHKVNQGLAMARNSGIAWTSEPYLFILDADNRIRPPALLRLLQALHNTGAAFSYSQLRLFGESADIGSADVWQPSRLIRGNYIDAMALIRRDALERVSGYHVLEVEQGWEDYDLWCRFAELGLEGVFIPELLCEYRVHNASMLRTQTNRQYNALMAEMALRHPQLFSRKDLLVPSG